MDDLERPKFKGGERVSVVGIDAKTQDPDRVVTAELEPQQSFPRADWRAIVLEVARRARRRSLDPPRVAPGLAVISADEHFHEILDTPSTYLGTPVERHQIARQLDRHGHATD